MTRPLAIEAVGVSKTFQIPHERRARLKEHFAQPFRRVEYERNEVLRDITFSIESGEFFGIVGPNGSGKSTLLKILAGIYTADAGVVHVRGKLSPFIELGVGFNFELSARDNIEINGALLGLSRREVEERLGTILSFSELERFVDQQLKNYSSGMLVRLGYAIAIQVPFEVLLLDEVLAVGDLRFQGKCFDTFGEMREQGKTIVLVSHDTASVEAFCDRVLYLSRGTVQAVGDPGEVIEQYKRDQEVGAEVGA